MNFFEKVKELINGIGDENQFEAQSEIGIKDNAENSIDKKGSLINAVMRVLKSNYTGMNISLKDYSLKLCINDSLFYNSLISDKFEEKLLTSIYDELGFEFGQIEIILGEVTDEMNQVLDSCYLHLQPIQNCQVTSRAVVCQVPGYGSIVGESVLLDLDKMESLPDRRYNIGAGRCPILSDNGYRENQIAIDDNPLSEMFNRNRFVSRAHAHISYAAEHGFLLCVEHGGTRIAQKRTHIYRGGTQIELNNPLVPEPLIDGDYIVLSKNVHLLFKKV